MSVEAPPAPSPVAGPLPQRPGYGTVGQRLTVHANLFEVTSFPSGKIYHYDLDVSALSRNLQDRIWSILEQRYASAFNGAKPVFDGRRNIYTARDLGFEEKKIDVVLPPEGKMKAMEFSLRVKKVAEIDTGELREALRGGGSKGTTFGPSSFSAIMAMDVVLRMVPAQMFTTRGRCFYIRRDKTMRTRGGVEIYPGYYQSVKWAGNKLAVNVDVSAASFFQAKGCHEMAAEILGRRDVEQLRGRFSAHDAQALKRKMVRLRIKTTHRGDRSREGTIQDLTDMPCDRCTFTDSTGKEQSVRDYFEKQYNRRLQFAFLPCIVINKARKIWLPMEVCEILPNQLYKKKLDPNQTADMIKFSSQKPMARRARIEEGVRNLRYDHNEYMKDFGLRVSSRMMQVSARMLPAPNVRYSPASRDPEIVPRGGAWNLRDKMVTKGSTLTSWAVASFCNPKDLTLQNIEKFVSELTRTARDTGMDIRCPKPYIAPPVNPNMLGQIESQLRDAYQRASQAFGRPELILCLLPDASTRLYAEIKRVTDIALGLSSQCVLQKHVRMASKQYCANVVLKMNVKLPLGTNQVLDQRAIPFIAEKPTIVLGGDVTHPSPGASGPSIAALVASVDPSATRYTGVVRSQEAKAEIIQDLTNMIMEVLKTFRAQTKQKPMRILFYRDGVSDGQFAEVRERELESIKKACRTLEPGYNPPVTFVIVKKKHHTRFFGQRNDCDKNGNLNPGLIVDQDVTHPRDFDFFLQAHAGLIGTCRPAHYYVLHDENKFTADALQTMTYNMCYTFCRCTRSVSVVPPAYYAHILAGRAKFHQRGGWAETSDTDPRRGGKKSGGSQAQTSSSETGGAVVPLMATKKEMAQVMYFM